MPETLTRSAETHSRAAALERRITIVAVVLPFVGFIAALVLLWGEGVTFRDLAILAVTYVLIGLGVTIGYHRMLTHRAFDAKPSLRAALSILGSMSIQGAPIHWVADHRRHHTFTDEEGDPHSPHLHAEDGWRGVLKGLWHAHMGWLFEGQRTSARRFAPDLRKDPLIRWVDKYFPLWALLGLAIPFVLGFALSGGSWWAGFTAFVWAGLVRVFLLHHATWSVNSICHMYGGQPFAIEDESRDNWMVALVSLGEGWHHSHHAFPTSAQHGLSKTQIDPSYMIIRGLERLGLVWNVKRPKDAQIEAKRIGATSPITPASARERQVA